MSDLTAVPTDALERVLTIAVNGTDITPHVKWWTFEPLAPVDGTEELRVILHPSLYWSWKFTVGPEMARWMRRKWRAVRPRYPRLNGQRGRSHHRPHRR